jgi:hypothetical protein
MLQVASDDISMVQHSVPVLTMELVQERWESDALSVRELILCLNFLAGQSWTVEGPIFPVGVEGISGWILSAFHGEFRMEQLSERSLRGHHALFR